MLISVFLLVTSELMFCFQYTACYDCENPNLPTEHGFYVIKNEKPNIQNDDYAIGTTPPGFSVRMSSIPNSGLGVFAETTIPANTRLGPYRGIIYDEPINEDQSYVWTIHYTDEFEEEYRYIDGKSKAHSSWMRYVNMADTIDQENLYVLQYNYEIYYVTYECIKPGTELLVWYGDDYGAIYGLERTEEDYQRRFNTSTEIDYLDTVPSEKVVQYSSTCYKFNRQCPFKNPPNRNGNFTKTCLLGAYYDICKYAACDINPCTGVADCGYCKEYCYYMGKYFRPYQEFENADNVNVCFCTVNLEIKCSEELSTYGDMCFY